MGNNEKYSLVSSSRKPRNIKLHNQKLVLSLFRTMTTASVSEISERINLSTTTVSKILAVLQENGLIKSIGKGSSTDEGGKKPELFALNETFKYAIGCYVGADHVKIILMNLKCQKIASKSKWFSQPESLHKSMQELAATVRQLVEENGLEAKDICGIAVGFDGIVEARSGAIYYPIHNEDWGCNILIRDILEEQLPEFENIWIDNSGRFGAYAIFLIWPEFKEQKMFNLFVGENSVGCLIDRGKIERGANGFLGEVGHMIILPSYRKRRCVCGSYGCFENLIGIDHILDIAREIGGECGDDQLFPRILAGRCGYKDIFDASELGNPYACRVVDEIVKYFSYLIRNLLLSCDPQIITITGPYASAGKYFEDALQKRIQSISFFKIEGRVKIEYLKGDGVCDSQLGGALYAMDQYLSTLELG